MAKNLTNSLKAALRNRMKNEVLKSITPESRAKQSNAITEKVEQVQRLSWANDIYIFLK